MTQDIVGMFSTIFNSAIGLFTKFVTYDNGLFTLFLSMFCIYMLTRFLIIPFVGSAFGFVGSDRAKLRKDNTGKDN